MRGGPAIALAVLTAAGAGCGGDGGERAAVKPAKAGDVVEEELFGYEMRIPAGWRSLGRAEKNSSFLFGGDGKGCQLDGGTPPPPVDDPGALLEESRSNYERYAEKPEGSRAEFELVDVGEGMVAVQSRITGPGEKRHLGVRIASASAAIGIGCVTDDASEAERERDFAVIYDTVELRTSEVAERLQPEVARLPAVETAWVEEEPRQLAAEIEVSDLERAEPSILKTARLLHDADPGRRIAVVAMLLEDPAQVAQAQIEQGTDVINYTARGGTRRIPVEG